MANYNELLIEQRADPFITRGPDGTYYFTASVPAYDRIELRASATIDGLRTAETRDVWVKHESGPMSEHIWAPELHYVMDGWYIYFAGSEKEDIWKLRPYVLKCLGDDPMKDEWVELGQMQPCDEDRYSFTDFSLDATIFENHGRWFYIWAEKVGGEKGISNLYIAELETPNKLKTIQVLLTTPDYDWERVDFWVNEGPAVLRHNGKLFVTYSASGTGACYCMGMLVADENDDLLDPRSWHKRRWPVLMTNPEKKVFGPGHNSFTTDEDGQDVLVYHARPYEEIVGNPLYDPNRHAWILSFSYDENGEPVFAI